MAMFRRFAFFIGLNICVVLALSLITSLLGIRPYLTAQGLNYPMLMAFCLVWGMGGAFISLALSKVMAKWMMGVKIIDPRSSSGEARQLVDTVHQLARQAGLKKMPEVGIYDSAEVNAFATGPSKNNSLVAVSTGLLNSMDQRSVEGVLGHEVAHIANGDMVTMTLLQGVVNAFVMAAARIVAFAISNFLRGDRDEEGGGINTLAFYVITFVLEIVFMLFGQILLAWFSRQREYRADAGGARYAGRDKMVSALQSLQRVSSVNYQVAQPEGAAAVASLKISATKGSKFLSLFSTHPDLQDRIVRLQKGA